VIAFFAVLRDGKRTRASVKREIERHPGINKKELCEKLGVAWNTIRHHVNVLQRRGQVHVEDRGWEHELYPSELKVQERAWLRALHDDDSAMVLEAVMADPGIGVYQMSEELGLSRKIIRTHLTRLMEDGVVRRIGSARPRYKPLDPPPGIDPFMRHQP